VSKQSRPNLCSHTRTVPAQPIMRTNLLGVMLFVLVIIITTPSLAHSRRGSEQFNDKPRLGLMYLVGDGACHFLREG
jgi:hypothetical protein